MDQASEQRANPMWKMLEKKIIRAMMTAPEIWDFFEEYRVGGKGVAVQRTITRIAMALFTQA
jgi:hypothetical protein